MATVENNPIDLDTAIAEAKAMLADLFRVMDIKRVIIVDDLLSDAPDFSNVIGGIQSLITEGKSLSFEELPNFQSINFSDPIDIWKPKFEKAWQLAKPEELNRLNELMPLEPGDTSDTHARGLLGRILADWQPEILSLDKWKARRDSLIASAISDPTLFLFDQDMTRNDGAPDEGMKTISSLIKQEHANAKVYYGLFSNTFDVNSEHNKHNEYAERYQIKDQRDRFALVSKQHLQENPLAFAFRLKRVAISPLCLKLKQRIYDVISAAAIEARGKVNDLDIYDFEQIVFQSSYKEGVWEADTLLRVYGLYHRDLSRIKAMQDDELRIASDKVRSVITYPFHRPSDNPASKVSEVAKIEYYDQDTYINTHYMPIEVGDIFQKTRGQKQYILLEQPCDLMIRGDTGKRNILNAILAEIVSHPLDKQASDSLFELPYHSADPNKISYVQLSSAIAVPMRILDLCAFRTDGVAKIQLNESCPDGVISSWKLRYKKLVSMTTNIINRYKTMANVGVENRSKLTNDLDRDLQAFLTESVREVIQGEIRLSPDLVQYNIKRVMRLRQPRAGSLLREYAYYKARDAFDHDITRTVENNVCRL